MAAVQSKAQVTAFLLFASVATGIIVLKRYGVTGGKKLEEEGEDDTHNNDALISNCSTPSDNAFVDVSSNCQRILTPDTITLAYASTTGTCQSLAKKLHEELVKKDATGKTIQIVPIAEVDFWDELLNQEQEDDVITESNAPILILFIPTWSHGTAPPSATNLTNALAEIRSDWRVASNPLSSSRLCVSAFGMGSTEYDNATFCKPVKESIKDLVALGASKICEVGMGDDAVGDYRTQFDAWAHKCVAGCLDRNNAATTTTSSTSCCNVNGNDSGNNGTCCGGNQNESSGACGSTEKLDSRDDSADDNEDDYSDYDESDEEEEPDVMDLEDIGTAMKNSSTKKKSSSSREPKEMVTPKQAAALKKEGYKLIGTHSAVKLCRWTKHQLRGRGGCYKHTFYGITSYQCMEATPSLACANKCVFCWRHHKNPVGKEWRWKTDDAKFIVDEAVKTHVKMIKEAKGIPGVRPERWLEAHTVRHCALSLVGEPIMYPHIGDLLGELHKRKISTYLVTNGQHPQAIESLRPITQLYVSVDAPTPESLEAIDRPLFKDAWERLRTSLKSLKDKGQRTVARLTVVKGWNSDEVEGYAKLIALGRVSLVEVKGVTFCGKSDASNLNMSNTPWHHEVVQITKKLQEELAKMTAAGGADAPPEYALACEHKHSCSVLLARVDQFAAVDPITGERKWRTWVDYEKFQELAARNEADPSFTFGVTDYLADTPSWAVFGATEEGFDPTDKRHRRKKKHPKYTKFDEAGIPTHDQDGTPIDDSERDRLRGLMKAREAEIGEEISVMEHKGGEKTILDARLMFRGLVVEK